MHTETINMKERKLESDERIARLQIESNERIFDKLTEQTERHHRELNYGQGVSIGDDAITVASDGHELVAQMSEIAVVAPVVALLLEHITFNTNQWSSNDIHALEASILTSTLGQGSSSGSRDVSHILGEHLETDSMPNPTKQCQWVDPKSGKKLHFPLQHAVDFAYYVDGEHSPAPSSVGESFCRPAIASRHSAAAEISSGASAQDVQGLFDPFSDDDDSPQDVSDSMGNASSAATGSKNCAKRLRGEKKGTDVDQRKLSRRHIALDRDALIVDKLSDDPENISCRFVVSVARTWSAPQRRFMSERSIIQLQKSRQPPRSMRLFHRRTKFLRHERVAWLESGGSNFDNLSASAEFAAATPAACIDDVVDATRVFLTYTRQYCCAELIELVEEIVKFLEETIKLVTWTAKELSGLVFWVNDVLEDFRDKVEAAGDLRSVCLRCSTQDRLLRDLMFVKVHRRVENFQSTVPAQAQRELSAGSRHIQSFQGQYNKQKLGRIPKNVLRHLPTQVDAASAVNGDGNDSSLHSDEKPYEKIKHVRQQSVELSCALVADYPCEEMDSRGLSVEGACGRHTPILSTESSEENGNADEVSCALVAGHPVEVTDSIGVPVEGARGRQPNFTKRNIFDENGEISKVSCAQVAKFPTDSAESKVALVGGVRGCQSERSHQNKLQYPANTIKAVSLSLASAGAARGSVITA
ncbi:unnamed protein product [Phytophthora fragariaefolia]|uniref:Unnamed protein product n=1 Tax=Phytophthora fragariaefolia TaxID=1490495 RepID=A0A9W6Y1Y6_9STRA|nr:unnamed protein product [Phytophthora fragariaefolia]